MSYTCPFCQQIFTLNSDTLAERDVSFAYNQTIMFHHDQEPDSLRIYFYRCPGCRKSSIEILGIGKQTKDIKMMFTPRSRATQFPHYIPASIREDYEEACLIATLSPKASATLLRRCLQGIIRDFYNESKNSLFDEINAIQNKVDSSIFPVLNAFREIGNIGAHPDRDINLIVDIVPGEVQKLIMGIEHLLKETYIKKHETDKLLKDIVSIGDSKKTSTKNKTV